ncbi:MAG: hypothetical protein ABMA14_15000 [Hyphomonadaceae bacterium]
MIDKKITAGVILALIVESAGVFAWEGGVSERRRDVEARVGTQAQMAERLARVEVKIDQVGAQLTRIERRLETRR